MYFVSWSRWEELTRQSLVLKEHVEVAGLLRRPFAGRICGAWREPDASRFNMDKHQEVEIDHASNRPLPLRREVALPHSGCMPLQEL